MALQIDLRQLVLLIASAVDLVGVDDILHGRRVGILAVECAKRLGWNEADQQMLFDAGLLHDVGISSTRIHRIMMNELDWSGADPHCDRGCQLLMGFAPLAHLAPIIRYHHTHWQDLRQGNIDPTIARFANLIFLADRIDACAAPYHAENSLLFHMHEICSLINRYRGSFFAPELVDAFLSAAQAEAIGKLQIPDEVLESPLKLTPFERAIMKKHSFATYQILKRVIGLEELAQWASQHHESLNGDGYPFRTPAGELPLESRIIKVADIFQALAQNRPYRKLLSDREILRLLRQMESDLEIDPLLVDFVASHLDGCQRAAVGSHAV